MTAILFVCFNKMLVDAVKRSLNDWGNIQISETNDPSAAAEMIRRKIPKVAIFNYGLMDIQYGGVDLAKLAAQNDVAFIVFVHRGRKTRHLLLAREAHLLGAKGVFYSYDFIGKPDNLVYQEFIRLIANIISN
jgi:chemotaxis response regulator CheB